MVAPGGIAIITDSFQKGDIPDVSVCGMKDDEDADDEDAGVSW